MGNDWSQGTRILIEVSVLVDSKSNTVRFNANSVRCSMVPLPCQTKTVTITPLIWKINSTSFKSRLLKLVPREAR